MSPAPALMRVVRRVGYWLRFAQNQDELREELAFHREQVAADVDRRGLDASAVRRTMGHETSMREESRDVWLAAGLDALLKDCRHAWRALRRTPAFTAVAVITLAIGIGANTAIFSVVHHLLLAPLPFPDGNRIVRLGAQSTGDPNTVWAIPGGVLRRLEQRSRALEEFSAATPLMTAIEGDRKRDVIHGALITPSFLGMLRVVPVIGRSFTDEDARAGAAPVAMIDYGLWQTRFAGARDAIGQTIRIQGMNRTIVGVTRRDLSIPMRDAEPPQVWLPLDPSMSVTGDDGFARLRRGATTEAARRELQAVMIELSDTTRARSIHASVTRAVDQVDERLKRALVILFAAVSGLLLIACANLANLLFMRGWTRQRELAIRRALGGGRWRIARQLLIESSTVALLGGALGLLVARQGLRIVVAMKGGPDLEGVVTNGAVIGWTAATTIVTSILFGVAPAFLSIGESTVDALRTGIRTAARSPVARRLRSAIVVGQIGASFVFLVAAALLVRSFVTLTRFDVGYDARGLAVATISMTRKPEPADVAATEHALLTAVRSVPGVTGAAFGGAVLQTDIRPGPFVIHRTLGDETLDLDMCETPFVSPDYFRVMGIPLVRGRTFENDDDLVVNLKFARRFWPNGDALGARLRAGGGAKARWLTVVGIAGDVNMPGVSELFTMQMYRPASTAGQLNMISFRARRNPEGLEAEVGRAIHASGVSATLSSIRGVESVLDTRVLARPRFALVLFAIFASIALLLTAVGLYSVVAYTVTHRTREIGVRVALGADAAAVTRMILADGMRHVASGVVLGVVVAFATMHLLTSFLYNGDASDPRAFAGAAIVLTAVTLVASSIPLRRALSVAPVDALRSD